MNPETENCMYTSFYIIKCLVGYFSIACRIKIGLVVLPEVLEQQKSLHLQISCMLKIKKIKFKKSLKLPSQIDLLDIHLPCTSRNGINWTISREATRPVELSSLSPLSASKIWEAIELQIIGGSHKIIEVYTMVYFHYREVLM